MTEDTHDLTLITPNAAILDGKIITAPSSTEWTLRPDTAWVPAFSNQEGYWFCVKNGKVEPVLLDDGTHFRYPLSQTTWHAATDEDLANARAMTVYTAMRTGVIPPDVALALLRGETTLDEVYAAYCKEVTSKASHEGL